MMTETVPGPPAHPEEMTAEIAFSAGSVALRARARATPAGLVAVGVLVGAILLAIVPIVAAARRRV